MLNSDYINIPHNTDKIVAGIADIIKEFFDKDDVFYLSMDDENFRNIVAMAQKEINNRDYPRKIIENIKEKIFELIEDDQILIQSNAYLRSARPKLSQEEENIGWHRESFYGPNMEKAFNIWTPIKGVEKDSTINYIPGSQNIPLKDIEFEYFDDSGIKKYSSSHEVGFLYRPKKITKGIEFDKAKPMIVPYCFSSLFEANLIHGSGHNFTNNIRFSIDFRIIAKKNYDIDQKKDTHFASGKDYFVELN